MKNKPIKVKKCEHCEATTNGSRDDYSEIGWCAFQVGNRKMKSYCPKHAHKGNVDIISEVLKDAK